MYFASALLFTMMICPHCHDLEFILRKYSYSTDTLKIFCLIASIKMFPRDHCVTTYLNKCQAFLKKK